jgi:hypothetical protein
LACKSADEFRDKVAEGEGYPVAELWKYPQSCLVHPIVFEAFGKSSTKRAGDLALKIMKELPEEGGSYYGKGDDNRSPQHAQHILLFLWAVENCRATKVTLTEAPDTDEFDRNAQATLGKLEKKIAVRGREKREEKGGLLEAPAKFVGRSKREGSDRSDNQPSSQGRKKERKEETKGGKRRKNPSPCHSSSSSFSGSGPPIQPGSKEEDPEGSASLPGRGHLLL